MQFALLLTGVAATIARLAEAQSVSGSAEGFAAGVTGGGDATAVYPADIDELVTYLTSSDPQVIVLQQEYNFIGSEGTADGTACTSWGTGDACQLIIEDAADCDATSVDVTYDTAGTTPIDVASDKTILGVGTLGVIRGKGLRFRDGATNIIVQNIHIVELNPKYVWGGDAISFDESSMIWIDHVQTEQIGRQHYVFGFGANPSITLSNNFINGVSPYSTGCDEHHYWTFEMVGRQHIYSTAGRAPALSGTTLLHACNNVWEDNNGHALEGDTDGRGLFEGNAFIDVTNPGDTSTFTAGAVYAVNDDDMAAACADYLGRNCQVNSYDNSAEMDLSDSSVLSEFDGVDVPECDTAANAASSVPSSAGNTL